MAASTTRPEDAANEARVRAGFWPKIRASIAYIPFAEDALAAYYCAFDRETPLYARAALWGALAYFVLPFDAIPDMLPLLGFTDDAAVLAGVVRLVIAHITPAHRDAARDAIARGLNAPD